MSNFVRRVIYLLVITLVVNVGGWTFNTEVLADVLRGDQETVAVKSVQVSDPSEAGKLAASEESCNHWCHAIGHFIGLFSHWTLVALEFAQGYSAQRSLIAQSFSPDGHFRPPKFFS